MRFNKIAVAMMASGKGILAADETTGTIKKRFDAIGVESTEDNRRDYRELLFRTEAAMANYISGVILYDETIRQKAKDGTPLVEIIAQAGAVPGIKVDAGAKPLAACPGETVTEGLDGLRERLDGISQARRALRQMARGHRHRRTGAPSQTCSPRTPRRSPATRRCARKPASCRSSSRKC